MKRILVTTFVLAGVISTVSAQCRRANYVNFRGKTYLFSWENGPTSRLELPWNQAQNVCRQHCMNLVSIESPQENNFIKQRIAQARIRYIWTSGRRYGNLINGWVWSGSGTRLGPTNNRANGDWSHTGGGGNRQPDNRENNPRDVGYRGIEESCLSILNNFYNDGLRWHDVACYHQKPFVCET